MIIASTKTKLDSIVILRYLGMQNVNSCYFFVAVICMLKHSQSVRVKLSNFLHQVQETTELFSSLFVLYSQESF